MNAISPQPQPAPEDEALERELREFEPVRPSNALKDRIRAAAAELGVETAAESEPELENVVRFPNLQTWISSAAAVVALGFGIALWIEHPGNSNIGLAGSGATNVEPSGIVAFGNPPRAGGSPYTLLDQTLVSQKYEGIVESDDGRPMWRMRYDLLNRAEWQDPDTGATHEHFTPEQRLIFVPVRHD